MKRRNHEYKWEKIRAFIGISIICLIAIIAIYFLSQTLELTLLSAGVCLILLILASASVDTQLYYFKPSDYSFPCRHYWLTKGKNILQATLICDELIFVLEDKETHIVTNESLCGFRTAIRTDITNTVVDLDKGYVYFPYSKKGEDTV